MTAAAMPDAVEDDARYTAELSAWLERSDVRLTRALKTLEWPTSAELFDALDLRFSEYDEYEKVLHRLVKAGNVTRRMDDGVARYEILLDLRPPEQNARPMAPGSEGEQRGAWFFWRGTWRPW